LDEALQILAQRSQELRRWCTHSFPLGSYRAAFALAANPGQGAAIKVSLQLGEEATR
jgi:threonine dehydrogenase-like Zn-dependent dehydrogenase